MACYCAKLRDNFGETKELHNTWNTGGNLPNLERWKILWGFWWRPMSPALRSPGQEAVERGRYFETSTNCPPLNDRRISEHEWMNNRMQISMFVKICGVSCVSLAKFEHLLLNADEKNCISHKIRTKIVVEYIYSLPKCFRILHLPIEKLRMNGYQITRRPQILIFWSTQSDNEYVIALQIWS